MDYPGSYVADIVETCQVYRDGYWRRANGVDHLVYCFERAVDPDVTGSATYFDTRDSDPIDQSESADEPAAWNRGDIRTLWLWDLYEDEWDGTFGGGGGGDGSYDGGGDYDGGDCGSKIICQT